MINLNTRKSAPISLILLLLLALAQPAHAQDIKKLNKKSVTDFIKATSKITSGSDLEGSQTDITEYLEKHLHQESNFKSSVTYNIPGFPSKDISLSLNKSEFIESIQSSVGTFSNYENTIKIKKIKLSRDKRKATVETTGTESGEIPVSADGISTEQVPVDGTSSCTQIINLENGIIQMREATCTTVIEFSEY